MLLLRYCQYGNCRAAKTKGKKQPPLFWIAPGRNRCVLLMNNSASSFLLILRIILFGKKTKKWHTKRGCRISKYFLLGGSPALCPNGIEIGHVFDAILYKRSSFPGIPFGMPDFRLFCFQLSKSMPFLMEKDNFPFFRSESCNEAY